MFTRGMVICGLLLAAGIDPGPRDLATTGNGADRPPVSTKLSDVAANAIDRGPIDGQLVQGTGCPWDCGGDTPDGNVGIVDFLDLLGDWNMIGTPCDFDGDGVGITDFLKLLANWGPCPAQPSCAWDCGLPPDGDVGIVDFLALLTQWGLIGTPCDFDGGGVGITDFLELLAHWGPCPDEPGDQVNFFLDQGMFDDALLPAGKDLKLEWDFNPHALPPASEVAVPDPLDISTHADSPSDPWSTAPPGEKCFDQPPNQINGVFSDVNCDSCGAGTPVAEADA